MPGGAVNVGITQMQPASCASSAWAGEYTAVRALSMPSACSAAARLIASSVAGSLATTRSGARAAAARACSSITSGVLSVGW